MPLLPDAEADGAGDGGEVNDVAGAALLEVGEELVYELKLGEMGGGVESLGYKRRCVSQSNEGALK